MALVKWIAPAGGCRRRGMQAGVGQPHRCLQPAGYFAMQVAAVSGVHTSRPV
jgi:hypothetical protein